MGLFRLSFKGAIVQNQTNIGMENMEPNSSRSGLNWQKILERAKLVLTDPKGCWSVIKAEPSDTKSLYMNWIIPTVGVSSVAIFLGISIWGMSAIGISFTPGIAYGLKYSLNNFIMQCVAIFISAQVISFLAPKFNGQSDAGAALKLVAYSSTASLVAGLLYLVPIPGKVILSLGLGIYGIYIFLAGVETMTGVPKEKKGLFVVASIVSSFVVMFVLNMILASILGVGSFGSSSDMGSADIKIGDASINTQQLEDFAKQLEKFAPKE